jgi:hypothetical protein
MDYKNKYILVGLLLWAFVSLWIHAYAASSEGTNVMTIPIVINFFIAKGILRTKWAKGKFIDVNHRKGTMIGIGFSCSLVVFIIQNILGAIILL